MTAGARTTVRRYAAWLSPARSSIKIPLPEIGREDVIHIHMYRAHEGTRGLRALDHRLIKHGLRLALAIRPRARLPCPPVPRSGRAPDYVVSDRPGTHPGMSVDPGAVHGQHRVDSPKPLDSNAIPGVEVDILIDTEEDRRRIRTPGCSVQPQSRLSVCHAPVVPEGVVRRVRPTRLAVLVVADDLKTLCAQRIRISAGDGLSLEVRARPRPGHILHYPVIACRFDLIR